MTTTTTANETYSKAYMKAKDAAYKTLRDAHRAEHDEVFTEVMKAQGFTDYGTNGAEARKARKIARLKKELAALGM